MRLDSCPNAFKVGAGQWGGGFVGRLQKPGFEFRRNLERPALLLAHGAKDLIDQFAGVGTDAGADLFLEEILNIFGPRNRHSGNVQRQWLGVKPACSLRVSPIVWRSFRGSRSCLFEALPTESRA